MKKCILSLSFSLLCFLLISQTASEWKVMKTGAGGWLTGMSIHPSGDPVFVRSDVGSAYRWDENKDEWINIVNSNTMPSNDVYWNRHSGVLSLVPAPSNANIAYLAYFDGIYKSADKGNTWTKTNFQNMEMPANEDDSKTSGERLAVDPVNENVVYFASIGNGLWKTDNGGNTWSQITAIPTGAIYRGVRQVLFDTNSGTTNNQTNRLYVTVDGEGVFQSNDSGTTWSISSLGTLDNPYFYDAEISASGKLYVCGEQPDGTSFGIQRYDGNAWNQVYNDPYTVGEMAIDPFNEDRIFHFSYGFNYSYKTNNASSNNPTWIEFTINGESSSDIPWLTWSQWGDWFVMGEVVFDPSTQGKLWMSDGVGSWISSDLEDSNMTWNSLSRGQEHLVSNDIVALPNDMAVTVHWDRPIFHHSDFDTYPLIHQPSSRFNSAWDLDQSPTDPNFLVALVEDHRFCCYDNETRNSGYSTDGGLTWTQFPSMPNPNNDGQIWGYLAISANDNDNIVWMPTLNEMPYYTTDRGTTWTQSNLPNASSDCCLSNTWFDRELLVADQVTPNTFYLYSWGDGSIYKSIDGGANWSKQQGVVSSYAYNAKLRAVHGKAGHLLFTRGPEQGIDLMDGIYQSKDGGATWNLFSGTDEVINVSVGKAAPNSTYPTIFFQGKYNGDYGYFMSIDEGQSWTKIGENPLGIYDVAKVMTADPFEYGRLFIGFAGNGFVYHRLFDTVSNNDIENDLNILIRPNPTNGRINFSGQQELLDINIYTMDGKRLLSKNNVENTLDISNIPSGLFLIEVVEINSGKKKIQKLIKK